MKINYFIIFLTFIYIIVSCSHNKTSVNTASRRIANFSCAEEKANKILEISKERLKYSVEKIFRIERKIMSLCNCSKNEAYGAILNKLIELFGEDHVLVNKYSSKN